MIASGRLHRLMFGDAKNVFGEKILLLHKLDASVRGGLGIILMVPFRWPCCVFTGLLGLFQSLDGELHCYKYRIGDRTNDRD